ncbi:MAG: FliI/YscN family ATPase [Planctomycetota bacterium]
MSEFDFQRYEGLIDAQPTGRFSGRVTRVVGLTIECRGLQVAMGELCSIKARGRSEPLLAEAVGFQDGSTLLMPLDEATGLGPGDTVQPLGRTLSVGCSESMLGRVLDALGNPLDDGPPLTRGIEMEVFAKAPAPLSRQRISQPFATGVSAIDGLMTLGYGQRVGIFAGSGVGKSTLLGSIARSSQGEVNVIALVGERGREVKEFIEASLGPEGLARSVVIVATSDAPPLLRFKASFTAMAIAEYFRDHGRQVLMMMDSVTRLANAAREIGLSLGEPPTIKGYPPSFFSTMPKLVERMGIAKGGSITGLLTVLVDADDMNEPVADTMRGLLDGHFVLSRKIASRGQYPALDVLESLSRLMEVVTEPKHQMAARQLRKHLAVYEDARDLISVGAYRRGSDPEIDAAVAIYPQIMDLLKQEPSECRSWEETLSRLTSLFGETPSPLRAF